MITNPLLQEQELPTLYGTYYPGKNIAIGDVIAEAIKVTQPLAKLKRWWHGTDNQGQYTVRSGESILDVGCGSGVSLLESKLMGAKAFGIEADPNVEAIAKPLGMNIYFGNVHDNPFSEKTFDLIIMNQVIEHITEPDKTLEILEKRLNPGGRIVLTYPNTDSLWRRIFGSRWINWHIPYHLHQFNKGNSTRMALRSGFHATSTRTITPNIWTLIQLRLDRYQRQIGKPSLLWGTTNNSATTKQNHPNSVKLRSLLLAGVMAMLGVVNRIVDTFGMADSVMMELHRIRKNDDSCCNPRT